MRSARSRGLAGEVAEAGDAAAAPSTLDWLNSIGAVGRRPRVAPVPAPAAEGGEDADPGARVRRARTLGSAAAPEPSRRGWRLCHDIRVSRIHTHRQLPTIQFKPQKAERSGLDTATSTRT